MRAAMQKPTEDSRSAHAEAEAFARAEAAREAVVQRLLAPTPRRGIMVLTDHTPGPWTITTRDGLRHFIHPDVAMVEAPDDNGHGIRNGKANADLISAAPDLLASLRELVFVVESVAHLQGREAELLPMADRARAAIAKAGGQS